jgi:hypothetical protein
MFVQDGFLYLIVTRHKLTVCLPALLPACVPACLPACMLACMNSCRTVSTGKYFKVCLLGGWEEGRQEGREKRRQTN